MRKLVATICPSCGVATAFQHRSFAYLASNSLKKLGPEPSPVVRGSGVESVRAERERLGVLWRNHTYWCESERTYIIQAVGRNTSQGSCSTERTVAVVTRVEQPVKTVISVDHRHRVHVELLCYLPHVELNQGLPFHACAPTPPVLGSFLVRHSVTSD